MKKHVRSFITSIFVNAIGWGAGLAIGVTIGVSQNNIALGIGVGVAIGAGLATTQMKKENTSSEV